MNLRGERRLKFKYRACVGLALSLTAYASEAVASVKLTLVPTQSSYVIGEPVKVELFLSNPGTDELRVFDMTRFSHDMEFLEYVVISPDGRRSERTYKLWEVDKFRDDDYVGVPLAPGERWVMFLYPNATYPLNGRADLERTFRTPGVYRLAVSYCPDRNETFGPTVTSNFIELHFREPSIVERDLLSPLWDDKGNSLSTGDNSIECALNRDRLRQKLEERHDDPLSRYLQMALVRSLLSFARRETYVEIRELLLDLKQRFPDFRKPEVAQWLGKACFRLGRTDEAQEIVRSELLEQPVLRNNYPFMREFIRTEQSEELFWSALAGWLEERSRGIDRYSEYERRPSDDAQ